MGLLSWKNNAEKEVEADGAPADSSQKSGKRSGIKEVGNYSWCRANEGAKQ